MARTGRGRAAKIDYPAQLAEFETWLDTPLGQAMLADQGMQVNRLTQGLSGVHQLWIGPGLRHRLKGEGDFAHCFSALPRWHEHIPDGTLVCDADELPFSNGSMDLVVLQHAHDFSGWPHQVIREACRVLRSKGHLLLIGFNPLSLWGLRKLFSRQPSAPWSGRFLFRNRLEDWLNLLDLETLSSDSHFYPPPFRHPAKLKSLKLLQRLRGERFLPFGAYYCILASKQTVARVAKRPRWASANVIPLSAPRALGPTGVPQRGAVKRAYDPESSHLYRRRLQR